MLQQLNFFEEWILERKQFNREIIQCSQYPQNCQAESQLSKQYCIEGHIGPLCQECDLQGKLWNQSYGKSGEKDCFKCKNFNQAANITIFILIFVFLLWQINSKITKSQQNTESQILITYLYKLGFKYRNLSKHQTETPSLHKILINYFQFMMIINSLDIQIPSISLFFDFYSSSGGDTSKNTINRIDCMLFLYQSTLPPYILKVLWINFQPIVLFLFAYIVGQFTLERKQLRQLIYTNFIIVFSIYQPTITKVLSQSFSCRQIGQKKYIALDLTNECLTDEHIYQLYTLIIPLTMLWVIITPLLLFSRLFYYQKELNSIKILYRYSYLYIEYRHEKYYWDIFRVFIRALTIIIINVFNFNTMFKGFTIIGLIFIYQRLSKKNKPYQLELLNKLDNESSYLVLYSLYLILISELSRNDILKLIISVCLLLINITFLLKMIKLIFLRPISTVESQRSVLQKIFFRLKIKFPKYFKWVELVQPNNTNVLKSWKKVELIINQIIKNQQITQQFQKMQIVKTKGSSTFIENSKLFDSKKENQTSNPHTSLNYMAQTQQQTQDSIFLTKEGEDSQTNIELMTQQSSPTYKRHRQSSPQSPKLQENTYLITRNKSIFSNQVNKTDDPI